MKVSEARTRAEAFVFVYCDDASHPSRIVPVTNFARTPSGWVEVPASRAGRSEVGTGRTLLGDTPARPGWASSDADGSTMRERHELVCRKCPGRPVPATWPKMSAALDRLAAAGVERVTLTGVAATLSSAAGR